MSQLPFPLTANDDGSSTSLLFDVDHETVQDPHQQQAGPSSSTTHNQSSTNVDMARRPAGNAKSRYEVPVLHAEEYALDDVDEEDGYGRASKQNNGNDHHDYPRAEEDRDASAASPLLFNGFSSPRDRDQSSGYEDGRSSMDALRHLLPEGEGAKSTLMAGIANMSNSILGAGIIGLPFAVTEAGFWTGIILLVILCGVTDWTIRLIILNAKLTGRDSYIGIMESCFGYPGRVAVSFFQFAFALGGGDTIPHVIASLFPWFKTTPVLWLLVNRKFVVFLATVFVSYPLSLYRDIGKLSRASSMALVSMFVIVFSVLVRGPTVDETLRGSSENVFSFIKPRVFEAIGVISFAYVCHHNSLLIYGSLHTPTLDRFNTITHVSTFLSLICCLIMSIAGYLSFTDKTEGNILNNFPATDTMINIARLCFGLNMFTTSPLEAFVCREVIETLYYPDQPFSYRRHIVVTTVLTFATMLVSMTTCDLGIVLEITGGLSATALAYLFPAMAYYKLCAGPWYSRQKLPAAACTAFGVIVMFLSLILSLKKLWNGEGGAGKVCE